MSNILVRVRRHLVDPRSHYRRITFGFLCVSIYVFIGKLAGAAKEIAIACRYGVSDTVDAYVFVFNIINLPISVWFGTLSVVLIPLVARIRHEDTAGLPRFQKELLGLAIVIGLGLGLLSLFALPILFQTGWLGLTGQAQAKALNMVKVMAILGPIGAVVSLYSTLLMACGRNHNSLFEAIPALVILTVLLLPYGLISEPLVWGTVAGFSLHLVAVSIYMQQQGELETPSFRFQSPAWQNFWASIGTMAAGQILMSFTSIIDQFFAVGLGTGALSTLNYANRILSLILGIGAIAISRSTLPIFSEGQALGNTEEVNNQAMRWAKWMFIFGLMVFFIGWITAHWMVSLLFERGEFTQLDSDRVSTIFQYSLPQIPFYTFTLTLVSLLCSQKRYNILLTSGLLSLILKILAATYLVALMKLKGLAVSSTCVYMGNAILLYYATYRRPK